MDVVEIKLELGISMETAKLVKAIIQGRKDPKDYISVKDYIYACFSDPDPFYLKLLAVNEVLGGYGVEHIGSISYVNMGYSFYPTIIFNGSYFSIGCIEDHIN